jgi:tetratricopeptide (TPR) repeat protein
MLPEVDLPAQELLDEAAEEFVRSDDRWGQALVFFVRMDLHFRIGTFDEAAGYGDRALSIFRPLDDHWGISAVQYHLGMALYRAGRLEAALNAYEGALAEGRRDGLANTVQYVLANMGDVRLLLGDVEGAARDFAGAHEVARELGAEGDPLASLGEGVLARRRGDLVSARREYTAALRLIGGQEKPDWTAAALAGLGFVAELSGDLDHAESQVAEPNRSTARRASGSHSSDGFPRPSGASLGSRRRGRVQCRAAGSPGRRGVSGVSS